MLYLLKFLLNTLVVYSTPPLHFEAEYLVSFYNLLGKNNESLRSSSIRKRSKFKDKAKKLL